MARLELPPPIAAYFEADKHDAEGFAQCFAEGAVVEDEGRAHSGIAAIKAWKSDVSTRYSYTSEPFAVKQNGDGYVVTSRLTGNFPGSPVDLRYTFRLEDGKIAFLQIAP